MSDSLFDLFNPQFTSNPYPFYARLREAEPIHFYGGHGMLPPTWFITRYDEVSSALRNRQLGRETAQVDVGALPDVVASMVAAQRQMMLFRDPPDHSRLRSLVSQAFTPRMVERLRPRVEAITNDCINHMLSSRTFDLIAELAKPLPVLVIAEMLGVPAIDRDRIKVWSQRLARTIDPSRDQADLLRGAEAMQEFEEYLRTIVAERRKQPSDDLISALIAVEEAGEKLTEQEMLTTCILLLIAGHETTTNLIGNGMLALLRHPEAMQQLREHPELPQTAVEEMLRYDGPIQMVTRAVLEDTELFGKQLHVGEQVGILLGSANHDPRQFTNPDSFDITRDPNKHVAFGLGIHFCLGAPLARLEGRVAVNTLLQRLPSLQLAEEPEWARTITFHGLSSLMVTVD